MSGQSSFNVKRCEKMWHAVDMILFEKSITSVRDDSERETFKELNRMENCFDM